MTAFNELRVWLILKEIVDFSLVWTLFLINENNMKERYTKDLMNLEVKNKDKPLSNWNGFISLFFAIINDNNLFGKSLKRIFFEVLYVNMYQISNLY